MPEGWASWAQATRNEGVDRMSVKDLRRAPASILPFPRRPGSFGCDVCHRSFTTGRLQLQDGVVVGGLCQACSDRGGFVDPMV
jgi:hypothetical protein